MISDANTEAILASLQTAETERGMMRVPLPKMIILDGEILNFRWQRLEELPESSGGDGFHSWDGHSRRRPFADSFSPSSKRKSSLPAEKSVSICASHRLCSRTRNHWTIRRYSSGGRPSIAASISSTRLILGVYHHPVLGFLVRWKRATPASMARLTQLVEAIHAARGFRDRGLTVAPCHAPVARRATLG